MKMRRWWCLWVWVVISGWAWGQKIDSRRDASLNVLQPEVDLIDAPTASILDYGSYSGRVRFYSEGGALGYISFGVLQRLNLGASLNVQRLIGNATPVDAQRPEVQIRLRFYDGSRYLPAFAVGFESQGYFYDRLKKDYLERERGLYLVASREIGLQGLFGHAGMNISDFNSDYLFGFLGLNFNIEDAVSLIAEYDNIRTFDVSRFNAGLRVFATPFFHFDFAVREIGKGNLERIIQIKYTGNF